MCCKVHFHGFVFIFSVLHSVFGISLPFADSVWLYHVPPLRRPIGCDAYCLQGDIADIRGARYASEGWLVRLRRLRPPIDATQEMHVQVCWLRLLSGARSTRRRFESFLAGDARFAEKLWREERVVKSAVRGESTASTGTCPGEPHGT